MTDKDKLLVAFDDGNIQIALQNEPQGVFVHCKIKTWSKSVYLKTSAAWAAILDELHRMGVTEVNTIVPKRDRKARKFQNMFGLHAHGETDDYVWYKMEV